MSRRSIAGIALALLFVFTLLNAGTTAQSEDSLLMSAIVSENAQDFDTALGIYAYLYESTGKEPYLVKASRAALATGGDLSHYTDLMQQYLSSNPNLNDSDFFTILIAMYLEQGDRQSAENIADNYLKLSDSEEDQWTMASLKTELGDPVEALFILNKIYKKNPSDDAIIQITELIKENNLTMLDPIIMLEKHIVNNPEVSSDVYVKLADLHAASGNDLRQIELLKKAYELEPEEYILKQIVQLALAREDYDTAIAFLKETGSEDELLFSLYIDKKDFSSATELAKSLYAKSSKPKWIAEQAMLLLEQADINGTANSVTVGKMQSMMNEAISKGASDPIYLNYYGYILIDRDLDVPRGVELIKKALTEDGANPYYLDSLAWGEYKMGRCSDAYRHLAMAFYNIGFEEKDIIEHWNRVDECMVKKMNWK